MINKYFDLELIKLCPRKYIHEFANKIINNGRNPEYLDLYLG